RRQDQIIERAVRELYELGQQERAERLERRMRVAASRLRGDGPAFGPEERMPDERRNHLEQAMGHLREAGLHDEAERLEERLRRAEARARGGRRAGGPQGRPLGDLREKVENLQQAVHEL